MVKRYLFYLSIYLFQEVGRAEETSTYSWSRCCTVNCRPTASNYQLFHLRSGREPNPDLRGRRHECYHSVKTTRSYTTMICSPVQTSGDCEANSQECNQGMMECVQLWHISLSCFPCILNTNESFFVQMLVNNSQD